MLLLIGSASPEASLLDLGAGRACSLLCAHRAVPPCASTPAASLCIPVPPYKDTGQIGLGVTLTARLFKPLSPNIVIFLGTGNWAESGGDTVQPTTCAFTSKDLRLSGKKDIKNVIITIQHKHCTNGC